MRKTSVVLGLIAVMFVGCASAPEARPDQRALEARANGTVETFIARDPSMRQLLSQSAGYAVFPEIAEAGLVVGGAQGVGVVYQNDQPIGYAELREGSLGLQLGGQTYAQIIVFDSLEALDRLKAGNLDLSANLTATALQSGAGAQVQFEGGTAVFVDSEAGLMAGASLAGEQISYIGK